MHWLNSNNGPVLAKSDKRKRPKIFWKSCFVWPACLLLLKECNIPAFFLQAEVCRSGGDILTVCFGSDEYIRFPLNIFVSGGGRRTCIFKQTWRVLTSALLNWGRSFVTARRLSSNINEMRLSVENTICRKIVLVLRVNVNFHRKNFLRTVAPRVLYRCVMWILAPLL